MKVFFGYFLGRWNESLAAYQTMMGQLQMFGAALARADTDWIMGYVYADLGEFDLARQAFQDYTDFRLEQNPELPNGFPGGSISSPAGWT